MEKSGEHPVVIAVESGGVWDLKVTPYTALRGLRDHIDPQRGVGLNFATTAGHLGLRLGPGHSITEIIEDFAEVVIVDSTVE